jgi:hypothetical protein
MGITLFICDSVGEEETPAIYHNTSKSMAKGKIMDERNSMCISNSRLLLTSRASTRAGRPTMEMLLILCTGLKIL